MVLSTRTCIVVALSALAAVQTLAKPAPTPNPPATPSTSVPFPVRSSACITPAYTPALTPATTPASTDTPTPAPTPAPTYATPTPAPTPATPQPPADPSTSVPFPARPSACFKPAKTPALTPATTPASTDTPTPAPTPAPTSATPTPAPTPALTSDPSCPRIRKSWDALTAAEQDTFKSAIEIATNRGLYQKFVLIHQEQMSNREAHGSCVFLFWHRKYLLGFENMLRSLGDQYKCLTLPYWDYVHNYATMQNTTQAQRCTSIETCAPVTTGLGGSTQGSTSSASFFGYTYANNRCVNQRPVNHMCTNPVSLSCPKCTPRGNWANTGMIPDMGIASIRQSVLGASDIRTVSRNIENSPHNILHNTLGGPMANPQISPMDPIFFLHHNTIDLLHTIFYHCKVEPLNLNDLEQQNDFRSFQGCSTRNGETIGPTSSLRMRLVVLDQAIEVANDRLVGSFFKDLPTQYYKLTDARQLGYSFDIVGLLGDLYTTCGSSRGSIRRLNSDQNVSHANVTIDHVVEPVVLEEDKNVLEFEKDVLAQAEIQGLTTDEANLELQKMNLLLQENCMPGPVEDFTPEFKAQWHITESSTSFALLQDIKSGANPVRIENWQDILAKHYHCRGDVKEVA